MSFPRESAHAAIVGAGVPSGKVAMGSATDNSQNGQEQSRGGRPLDRTGEGQSHCGDQLPATWFHDAAITLTYTSSGQFPGGSVLRTVSTTLARYSTIIALAACASSGSGSSTTRAAPDRLTRAEIVASSATNAYEMISRLRPQWLRPPATGSIGAGAPRNQAILVYLDRQRLQDLNALKTISIDSIDSAQWIDATRAPTVLPDVPTTPIAGAIVIRSR